MKKGEELSSQIKFIYGGLVFISMAFVNYFFYPDAETAYDNIGYLGVLYSAMVALLYSIVGRFGTLILLICIAFIFFLLYFLKGPKKIS